MPELDWSIIRSNGPVDIAGNFARGYEIADKIRTRHEQQSALGALSQNPDDRNALAALYRVSPETASRLELMNMKRHEVSDQATARGALADFIMGPQGIPTPNALTGVVPAGPEIVAPAARAADPLAPLPDAAPADVAPTDAPATPPTDGMIRRPPMSDSWKNYVKTDPEGAMKFLLQRANLGKEQAAAVAGQMEVIADLTRGVKDQATYDAAREKAHSLGYDTSHLPDQYDPAEVENIQRQALSATQHLTLLQNAADDQVDNKETERHHKAEEGNTQRGQDLSHGDRVRGQDLGSVDRERGQDLSSVDRQRGQDLSSVDRERGQDTSSADRKRGQDKRKGGGGSARPTIIVNPKTGARMKLVNGAWVLA